MSYKVEKKADGWYVDGERHASQTAATKTLIALLSGKAAPKRTAAPKKAEKEWGIMVGAGRVKTPRERIGFTYLGWDYDIGDLVNGEAIEGFAAKVIGTVAHPPKGMNPDVTSIVIVEHAAARGESIRYTVIAFDDEAVYEKTLYRGIPDVLTAEMLAKAAWGGMNHHAGHYTPELLAAQKKYATKTQL